MNIHSRIRNISVFSLFLFALIQPALAQQFRGKAIDLDDPDQVHILKTIDGQKLEGQIISIENTTVEFFRQRTLTFHTFRLSYLKEIIVKEGGESKTQKIKMKFNTADIPTGINDLLYTTTAFPIPKGVLQYRTELGITHEFEYGFSNHISMGIGYILPTMIIMDLNATTANLDGLFRVGIGAKTSILGFRNEEIPSYLEVYLNSSIGTPDLFLNYNVSLISFSANSFFGFDPDRALISAGGSARISDHLRLMGQTYFIFDSSEFIFSPSIGISWFNPNNSFEIGFKPTKNLSIINEVITPFINNPRLSSMPLISYTHYFF